MAYSTRSIWCCLAAVAVIGPVGCGSLLSDSDRGVDREAERIKDHQAEPSVKAAFDGMRYYHVAPLHANIDRLTTLVAEADLSDDPAVQEVGADFAVALERLMLVNQLVGDAPAHELSECRAVGFGVKFCGGPTNHLVFSTTHTDSLILADAISAYNRVDDALNYKYSVWSDCMMEPPPLPLLVDGRCADSRMYEIMTQ